MAVADYFDTVQKVYIAFYQRPADPAGLYYWSQRVNAENGNLSAVIDAFANSAEATRLFFPTAAEGETLYDLLTEENIGGVIDAIYLALFNRAPDEAGKQFYVDGFADGTFTAGNIMLNILNGAQGDDAVAVANKLEVASLFTTALDPEQDGIGPFQATYNAADEQVARDWLATVTSDPATRKTESEVVTDIQTAIADSGDAILGQTAGQTFTLTTDQDNVPGTAGNDTILGVFDGGATSNQNTLTAADVINGGAGKDSLMATLDAGSAGVLPAAQYSNIENFFIRNVSGVNPVNTFNFASYSGEEQVWNDRSSNDVVVTGLAAGTTVGVKGNGAVVAGATNATYVNTATAANIALDGGIATGSAAVSVNGGAGMTSATLTSTGGANSIGGLNLAAATTGLTVDAQSNVVTGNIAGAGLTTVTVKGAGSANIGNLAIGAGTVTTVNAADNAGGVTATLNGQTNFKFTGGAGNDVVTTGAVLVATASVDAGAGTADRLVVANTNHIRVDGTSKALGDLYKGFEQVQVQDGVNLNLANLSTNNTIDTVRINDTSGTTSVTGISAAAAQNVTILNAQGAITIGLAGATTTGQIDTVKAAVTTTTAPVAGPQNVSLLGVNLAGVENLELTGSNGSIAANVGRIQLNTTNAIDLANIKLNNANAVDANGANDNIITVSAGSRAINLTIDATGSGDTRIDASAYNTATGARITTGAGNDVITGSARADVIVAGAGDDTITGDVVTLSTFQAGVTTIDFTSAYAANPTSVALNITGGTLAAPVVVAAQASAAAMAAAASVALAGAGLTTSVSGNVVTITSATNIAEDLTVASTTVPAPVASTGASSVLTPAVTAVASSYTLTFAQAAGTFVAGDVVAYVIDDAGTGVAEEVNYTVAPGDVVAGDGAATAANVAAGLAAAFNVATATVTAVRVGNVVTVTSDTAGLTGNNQSWTPVLDTETTISAAVNTATGVTLAEVSNGVDAVAANENITIADYGVVAVGDVLTVTLAGVSATIAGAGANVTGANIAAALDAADPAAVFDAYVAGATLGLGTDNATPDQISFSLQGANAPGTVVDTPVNGTAAGVATVLAAADTLTGGEGNDVFVINYSNVDTAGNDLVNQVTFSAMDTITDLNLGGNVAGTNVDTIDLPFAVGTLVNAGAPVAMASTAADLYDAVQALYATGGTMDNAGVGTAGLFTYGGDTYLIAEAAGNSVFGADDIIIKVTGLTGTLNLTDLV